MPRKKTATHSEEKTKPRGRKKRGVRREGAGARRWYKASGEKKAGGSEPERSPARTGIGKDMQTPCGHRVSHREVISLIKKCLDQKRLEFGCPVCETQWEWREVRNLAELPESELKPLEEKVNQILLDSSHLYKKCPTCDHILKRAVDTFGTPCPYVKCPLCSQKQGKPHLFCWSCHSRWPVPECASPGQCANSSCELVATLLTCPTVTDFSSKVYGCPIFRSCPRCHSLIMHEKGCKYVRCQSCRHSFCFICLERSRICRKDEELYFSLMCKKPRAKRQTFFTQMPK
nr:PREDICTED: E3 ubiquitin-protein ligase HEL2-like [Lepisosteus oculatus]